MDSLTRTIVLIVLMVMILLLLVHILFKLEELNPPRHARPKRKHNITTVRIARLPFSFIPSDCREVSTTLRSMGEAVSGYSDNFCITIETTEKID